MKGQLRGHPLAELIREISSARLTGALRIARERAKIVVYFDDGDLIYAVSNLRMFRLSECLRRWGMPNEAETVSAREGDSDFELGASLVESGLITEGALGDLRARQVADTLRPALLWIEGEWEFDARVRLAEELRVSLTLNDLLIEAARRLPEGFVASRFTNSDEKLSPVPEAAMNSALRPEEAFVMSRVSEPLSVGELLSLSGLSLSKTFLALYALVSGGIVRRELEPRAFTVEEIEDAVKLKGVVAKAASPQKSVESKAAEKISEQKRQESPETKEEFNEERELRELFARVEGAESYYEVLGVIRTASPADIKRSYYSHAKRFHPDKFRQHPDANLRTRIESAFADIAQAYDTLKDKSQRAAYDLSLAAKLKRGAAGGRPASVRAEMPWARSKAAGQNNERESVLASAQAAEENFKRGVAAMEQGNLGQAISFLGEAARSAPNRAEYRAQFGRALAGDAKTRRQAEAEIQAAIAIDGSNALYHIFLAELYRDLGLQRRAQTEIERALSLEPQNTRARLLLDNLTVRRQSLDS